MERVRSHDNTNWSVQSFRSLEGSEDLRKLTLTAGRHAISTEHHAATQDVAAAESLLRRSSCSRRPSHHQASIRQHATDKSRLSSKGAPVPDSLIPLHLAMY
eukprot:3705039-Amphidinium_carterae.1